MHPFTYIKAQSPDAAHNALLDGGNGAFFAGGNHTNRPDEASMFCSLRSWSTLPNFLFLR